MNTPHASGALWELFNGDCAHVMRNMSAESVDSIVTDPPYGLSFMGKEWDHGIPGSAFWVEALRVAKPGAHLLAFGGTRTFHRLAVAIEDAGWEIRDCVMWLYGKGFPKSHNIGKAIDRERGAERVATADAERWSGWGTALKPAWEPVLVCRKPIADGLTVAGNVVAHGCGALNVDACRIPMGSEYDPNAIQRQQNANGVVNFAASYMIGKEIPTYNANGRWPANVAHDGSDDVLALLPSDGVGSAARFFYCAKASDDDRNDGGTHNTHPTVKPHDLMRWLCRMVTPPGGTVLDPFMGSGSTGKAAISEGFRFVGIDIAAEYCDIAAARIRSVHNLFNA